MALAPTANYQAGIEANAVKLSYCRETSWGVPVPGGAWQTLRYVSETLAGTKTRANPNEQTGYRSASAMTTTQESAGGALTIAFSYGTYDDFLASVVGNDWVNNVLVDSNEPIMFTLQKTFSPTLAMTYPGSYVSALSLTINNGGFVTGTVTFLSKEEDPQTAPLNTTAAAVATTTTVFNTLAMFGNLLLNGASTPVVIDQLGLTLTNTSAAGEYGLGSASAQGMLLGTFTGSGSLRAYFRDFSLYTSFKSEAIQTLQWTMTDPAGNSYTFLLPSVRIMTPKINSGGRGQAVMEMFDLELSADSQGRTIVITRTPHS